MMRLATASKIKIILQWIAVYAAFLPWAGLTHALPAYSTDQDSGTGSMVLEALPLSATSPDHYPPSPAQINLGRLLFFDPVLSSNQEVACATCHHPNHGWADGRATPLGIGGVGLGPARKATRPIDSPTLLRNVPSLLNVGFNGLTAGQLNAPADAPMFWDSRTKGLETQVFFPLSTPGEMLDDARHISSAVSNAVQRIQSIPEYRNLFAQAFAVEESSAVTPGHLSQAIAAFERTLVTPQSAFDRYLRGETSALNEEQLRGMEVFKNAGCIRCHNGPMLSDFKLHFIGVPDSAQDGTSEFRTPTLRNLKRTAPYMHNGSMRSIREVLVFYDNLSEAVSETLDGGDHTSAPRLDPLLKHLQLNPDDFPALEAFLSTLNDQEPTVIPTKVPSGRPLPCPSSLP